MDEVKLKNTTGGGVTKISTKVRALTANVKRTDISRQAENIDNFVSTNLSGVTLQTPYSMKLLSDVYEQSNMLKQCVAAIVTNVVAHGYRVAPLDIDVPMEEKEKQLLQSFIKSPNTEESLVKLNSKKVTDYEEYGFGFVEVIRDARARPSLLKHAKSFDIRLMKKTGDPVPVSTKIARGGSRSTVTEFKKFRKYVQMVGTQKRFFKEFGDPRIMDFTTGDYETDGHKVPKLKRATELLHHKQYSEDSYGIPRWISQLPSVLGSREAEEVNLRYFEDNTVPPMLLSVAGGRLTRQSFQDLNKLLSGKGVGRDRQNQILLIEAIAETAGIEDSGSVQLKVDKLTDARPSDALFKDYDDSNMAKIRSSFRLPSVAVGMSETLNFATANVSAYIAETQVYLPERNEHDEFLNKGFINHPNGLNLQTVKLESKGPSVSNPDQIVKTLTATNVMGGVTPRASIDVVNETMQLSIPQYPKKGEENYAEWMDEPIALGLKKSIGATQQTGEGDSDHDDQSLKDQDIKDRESDGETGVGENAVEHGQE